MQTTNPKIIFMGTPEFAVPSLTAVHARYGISAVVTVPDKEQGRGRHPLPSAVKLKALELGLPVLQPENLKDNKFKQALMEITPDIMLVVAFRILPREIYTIPSLGAFNIHGSLLPRYRGAAPINHAIINGDKISGLTSFILEQKVDTGSIIMRKELAIPEGATAGDLHDLLMPLSAELALETIEKILAGDCNFEVQDESLVSPAPKIFPEDCKINFNLENIGLRNFIHGVSPVPGAWCLWNSQRLKLFRVETVNNALGLNPGEYSINNNCFIVGCANGALKIVELQLQGGKKMKADDFSRGFRGVTRGCFDF